MTKNAFDADRHPRAPAQGSSRLALTGLTATPVITVEKLAKLGAVWILGPMPEDDDHGGSLSC